MARENVERAYCDWGSHDEGAPEPCDNTAATPGQGKLKPTGWLFGEVVNGDETLDLCPKHRDLAIRMIAQGGLPDDVEL